MTKKQLQEYIEEIRPKADAYEGVCSTLGIDKDILGYIEKIKANPVEPLVIRQTAEELTKVIEAGNKLAEAAHYLQKEYDGVHRLRLALSEWYKVRADEFGRDKSSLSV